jgi:hypothetical protein
MDKKDIYEHLAKIYLDASSKRKKKKKVGPHFLKNLFFLSLVFLFGFSIFLVSRFIKIKTLNAEIALVLCPDAVKINFHFDPAKKEIYSLDLNKLDLTRFKTLGFALKKTDYKNNLSVRVEFTSTFNEKSEYYIKDIKNAWQDYKINLSEFKNIGDWSEMLKLSFIVEEWNVREKRGIVYIDNIRLLR